VHVRLPLPARIRLRSDEVLALALASVLCASGPGGLVGRRMPVRDVENGRPAPTSP
jgi:hypothetical protein